MNTADFNFHLPKELIAQTPLVDRSASRLLTLDKNTGKIADLQFTDLRGILQPGDCLVLNDTKVLPARLIGKTPNGGKVEVLLLKRLTAEIWDVLVKPGRKMRIGDTAVFGAGLLSIRVLKIKDDGIREAELSYSGIFEEVLNKIGEAPLPPYITKKLEDKARYQTVYAKHNGAAAAPTAGLHFTQSFLNELNALGVNTAFVTLHVGLGTFRPVKATKIEEHKMHEEWYSINKTEAKKINAAKKSGGRIIAVGTTSLRTLETAAENDGYINAKSGTTDIFIYPGYTFKITDALITNFHLPESTLIMLVSALAGRENILAAYEHAVKLKYRFFSFGDAMLIL